MPIKSFSDFLLDFVLHPELTICKQYKPHTRRYLPTHRQFPPLQAKQPQFLLNLSHMLKLTPTTIANCSGSASSSYWSFKAASWFIWSALGMFLISCSRMDAVRFSWSQARIRRLSSLYGTLMDPSNMAVETNQRRQRWDWVENSISFKVWTPSKVAVEIKQTK